VPGLAWAPEVARRNRDVWLYYVDRQALLPRAHVLDGLEGAFDEDRVGWAPRDAALSSKERIPSRYREHHGRLRLANVRFVLSFRPLPDELVRGLREVSIPEVAEPLRLFELKDALPRVFRASRFEVVPDPEVLRGRLEAPDFNPRDLALLEASGADLPSAGPPPPAGEGADEVRYQLLDPHTVRVEARGPPGLLVVLDGYHRDWKAYVNGEPRPVLRADGRYRALATRGGGEVLTLRYEPSWRLAALMACALGAALALGLAGRALAGPRGLAAAS
jgi:hypothetical protein